MLKSGLITAVYIITQLTLPPNILALDMTSPKQSDIQQLVQSPLSELIMLTVDKSRLRADLRTLPPVNKESKILKSFRIAIGRETGDKNFEGDNKTPEGIYFAQKHINTQVIQPSKYGTRAIPLNFPNTIDKFHGKTGYGIWLHGAGNDDRIADAQVTEGCVAFYNADIIKLKSWLRPNQGVVVIANDINNVNIGSDVSSIHNLTNSWLSAWNSKNHSEYTNMYDQQFKLARRNLQAFKKYKRRVFRSYQKMSVKISNLRVITHPKYAISLMNLNFNGDNRYISKGRKVLYWRRQEGGWKILREYFSENKFRTNHYSKTDIANLHLSNKHG